MPKLLRESLQGLGAMDESKPTDIRTLDGLLRGILERMPVGIVVNSPDGPVWLNRAAAAIGGYESAAQLGGLGLAELVHPDDLAFSVERARHMIESGEPGEPTTLRLRHRAGDWVEVEVVPVQVVELAGRPANLLVLHNVTERRAAQEALRATESRYRAIFDSTGVGILLSDLDGRAVAANPAIRDLLGWSDFQPGRVRPRDLIHPDDLELVAENDQNLREGRSNRFDHELRLRRADGSWVWVHMHASLVRGTADVPLFTVAIVEDITGRKQLEEQLRLSQRLESIGRLAGGIAHDFNNIITVITGHTDLVIEMLEPGNPLLEDVKEIREAGNRAAGLTRQLLAFSRRQVLQPRVLDLNEVIAGMQRMLERIIGEDVEMTFDLAPRLGLVRADPAQIEQVILNLVVNARDAMPQGGRLQVSTQDRMLDAAFVHNHPGSAQGPHVGVSIRDTGHGMSEEVLARIFEPFFTTKDPGKGTGLGLSMSYGIVKQSGGYVLVESQPWEGSTFTVYLPRCEDEAAVASVEQPHPVDTGGPETVLVVEDEKMVRGLACRILERIGYRVLEAADADEALEALAKHPGDIDLLLTDVVMPRVSGPELARIVHATRPELPVLYMSGYTDDAVGREGVLDPSVPFLQKPFTPDGLARKVREVLAGEPPH